MRIPKWLKKSGLASDLDLYPNHFVFTFVRNPFDRFLSFFLQGSRSLRVVKEDGFLDQDIFNGRQGDIDTQNLHILPSPYGSLEECAEQTQQGLWKLKENLFIHGNKYTYVQLRFERWHSKSQARFLLELSVSVNRPRSYFDGNPCSFIGRVENFEQDFSSLVSLLGCRTLPVEKRNVSHEREAAGEKRHYSTYYTKRARTLVEEIYAKDLDLLGYEFEDETKTSVPVSLYDMDRLKKQREENLFWNMGFRLYMIKLYFVTKRTTNLILRGILTGVVKKTPVLNYIYQMLYRPLKSWITGAPLNAREYK